LNAVVRFVEGALGEDFGLEAVAGVGQLDARLPEVAAKQTEAEDATGVLVERTADVPGVLASTARISAASR
jgi:hypothetical protein